MTDIELLPLPEGVDVIFSPDGNGAALDVFTAEQVQDYARACVAHATEPMRAHRERLTLYVLDLEADRSDLIASCDSYRRRAERLAEALRDALECGEDGDWQSARNYINEALRDHNSVEST